MTITILLSRSIIPTITNSGLVELYPQNILASQAVFTHCRFVTYAERPVAGGCPANTSYLN